MDQAARGAAALKAGNHEEAIQHYTSAISTNSQAVDYYIKRSTAYQRAAKYPEALADAEIAVVLAHKRSRRELIKDSQIRRALSLYFTERYGDAEFVLNIAKKLDEKDSTEKKDKTLPTWDIKIRNKLSALDADDERRKVSAKEVPEVELPGKESVKAVKTEDGKSSAAPTPTAPQPTPAHKIKHDWYQNNENVYFTLLAKGVPKEKATVEIGKDSLSISFPIDGSSDFDYSVDPFFAEVDASQSTFRITPTKIEATLRKATPGVKWKSLEGDREVGSTSDQPTTSIPSHILNEQPPSYPTSSKKGAKDWDKLAKDLTTTKSKDDKGEDKVMEDADDDEGDDTNRFFKQLFKGATPEAQRAMMKSYQESGGTVLSTDWNDVGKRTVVPEPPEGMEAKKYGK